jgi:hypothetical protein
MRYVKARGIFGLAQGHSIEASRVDSTGLIEMRRPTGELTLAAINNKTTRFALYLEPTVASGACRFAVGPA